MKRTLLFLGLSLLLAATPFTGSVNAEGESAPTPQSKEVIRKQIDNEREKQVQYHIQEFKSLDKSARQSFLSDYNYPVQEQRLSLDSIDSEQYVESYFEDLLANAYIYTMDDNGYVYDKEGDVVNQLDLSEASRQDTEIAPDTLSETGISPAAVTVDTSINGSNTGAFARQVTTSGYKGIKTSFILPTDNYFNTPDSTVVGYLYNGIDVLSSSQLSGYKLEGGLQYSEEYDNYTAIIHPLGIPQNAIPQGYTTEPPRYAQGTPVISNLLYDTASAQFKYFVNGTNVNGVSQYIYFYYNDKTLTSTEISALTVKRVVALAKTGYAGTNIGNVQVTYTGTTVTTTSGSTVDLTSAMLSNHYYNGKTHGTADTPASAVTKAGGITTQKINVNTTGF